MWICLRDKVLEIRVCRFVTWLRFGCLAGTRSLTGEKYAFRTGRCWCRWPQLDSDGLLGLESTFANWKWLANEAENFSVPGGIS